MRAPTYTAAPRPPTGSGRRGPPAPTAAIIEVGMRRLGQEFGLLVALVGCGSGASVGRDGAADGHADAAGGGAAGMTASPFKAADLNGDGKADMLLSFSDTSGRYVVTLARGNVDGTFGLPTNPPPATSLSFRPGSSLVADFNGDKRDDVFLVGKQPNGTAVGPVCLATISAGASSIDPSIIENCSTVLAAVGDTFVAAVADVNNDGKLDGLFIVLAGGGTSEPPRQYRLAVALGNGSGGFTLAPSTGPYGIVGTEGVTVAIPVDCNGDGQIDLAVSNRSLDPGVAGPPNAILYGDGSGQFSVSPP